MPRIRTVDGIHMSYRLSKSAQVRWQGGTIARREAVFVRIRTADGRTGWGEIGEVYFDPELYVALLNRRVREFLIGRESAAIESLHDALRIRLVPLGYAGMARAVLSGVDLALHNLCPPARSAPLAVPVYASTGFHPHLDGLTEECERAVALGFRLVKIRGGFSVREDVRRVKRARSSLGADVGLILELGQPYAAHPYAYREVERLCAAIREWRVAWVEEPFWPEDIRAYRRLHRRGLTPIGAGENLYTEEQFRMFAGVLDVCQPDLTRMGGVTAFRRIARLCRALAPHQFGGSVALLTTCRAAGALRNLWAVELDLLPNPWREQIFGKSNRLSNGKLNVPPYHLADFDPKVSLSK
ncbi:MAG: mandelate racemase/muconate lactonizing enzyme family protein [Verrucomicrobia bacterium]|nr:mandelate racemase/muconate lactonizing enzyme family protein [Verrucomicrobiota bacterium]